GLVGESPEILPRVTQHVPVQAFDRPRILPDEQVREIADRADDTVGAPVVAALAPSDQTIVGFDPNEGPGPPAAVAVQRLHARDLHRRSPRSVRFAQRQDVTPRRKGSSSSRRTRPPALARARVAGVLYPHVARKRSTSARSGCVVTCSSVSSLSSTNQSEGR